MDSDQKLIFGEEEGDILDMNDFRIINQFWMWLALSGNQSRNTDFWSVGC